MGGGLPPTVATDLLQVSRGLRVLPFQTTAALAAVMASAAPTPVSIRPRLVDYPTVTIPAMGAFRCLPPIDPRNGAS
jgi:hypothetical protein